MHEWHPLWRQCTAEFLLFLTVVYNSLGYMLQVEFWCCT